MWRSRLAAAAGGAVLSLSGVLVAASGAGAVRSALLRTIYALPVLLLIAVALARRKHIAATDMIIPSIVALGVLEGIEVIAYHAAVVRAGVGLATVLVSLQVVVAPLLARILLTEKVSGTSLAAVPLALVGVGLIALGRGADTDGGVLGITLGLVSATVYAAYLVGLRTVRSRRDVTVAATLLSATPGMLVAVGVAAMLTGTFGPADSLEANLWLLLLAVNTPVVGWWLVTASLRRLAMVVVAVLLVLQPALAVLWGIVLFDEPVSAQRFVGFTVVLASVALTTMNPGRPCKDGARPTA